MSLSNTAVARVTIIITILTVVGKFCGLLRETALAYAFGTSGITDAYVLAQSVFGLLVGVVVAGFVTGVMPVYQKLKLDDDTESISYFLGNLYTVGSISIIVVTLITVLIADPLVYLLSPKFDAERHDLAVLLTRIISISTVFNFINNVQMQHLKAENKFIPSTLNSFILNGVLIAILVFVAPSMGIESVAWGNVIAAILICIMLQIFVKKLGYKFKPHFNLKNEALRLVGKMGIPIIIGSSVSSINSIVDRILASGLAVGSIAALSFSSKLTGFISGTISMGMGAVCYTKLAQLAARENYEEFKRFLTTILNTLLVIVIPATVGIIILASPAVELVFEYGAFDEQSREMTSYALIFYSIGLIGTVFREMTTYGLYALHDTKSPLYNSIIGVIINIIGNLILVQVMGIGGLALATSIASLIIAVLMLNSLRKKVGALGLKEVLITLVKTLTASGVMGIAIYFIYPALKGVLIRNSLSLILTILCGALIYTIIIYFMHIKEVDSMLRLAKNKLARLTHRSS